MTKTSDEYSNGRWCVIKILVSESYAMQGVVRHGPNMIYRFLLRNHSDCKRFILKPKVIIVLVATYTAVYVSRVSGSEVSLKAYQVPGII